jgi:hypothetical protein
MILLGVFKNSRLPAMGGVVLLAFTLFAKSFIPSGEISQVSSMPFYNAVFGSLFSVPLLDRIVAMVLLLVLCTMLIRIGARYLLFEFRTFMPAFFLLLFVAVLPSARQVSPPLVGSLFYLTSFAILFDGPEKRTDTLSVFAAGLVLALGSMFYLKLVWFVPLIWISLPILRPVTWRDMTYPVVAFFLLGLFLFTWYWSVRNDADGFVELISQNLAFKRSSQTFHYSIYLYYAIFLLLVTLASIHMVNRFQARKTVVQNTYQVLFYMFVAGILFYILIARFDPAGLVYLAFPVSFILTDYFHRKRNPWIHELFMWILVGLAVFTQWMT